MSRVLRVSPRTVWSCAALLAAAWVLQIASLAQAELPTAPSARDRQIALAVTTRLRQSHLSRQPLDDEVSRRCLKTFLKSLDPMKLYFYQEDVDAFRELETSLDDLARSLRGDKEMRFLQFAYDVYSTFLKRVDERVEVIDTLLARQHDFTVDEEMVTDPDVIQYARNPQEAYERWRKRIKYDLLLLKAEGVEGDEAIERLTRRYHSFAKRMRQTDGDELLEMYLSALTMAYDPHTTYMSPRNLENFEISMRLQLEGIGAALQSKDGYTTVARVIPGGAADKHGRLKADDRITGVGQGAEGEIVDVVDMKLSDVVDMIRGERDTIVRLQVLPVGQNVPEVYNITRAKIELKDSEARSAIFDAGQKPGASEPYKIGVIVLDSFYMDMEGARRRLPDFKSTTRDVDRILGEFKREGVDAVVMDLRHNGGGSLTEAINLTGLFIDRGPVVQVRGAEGPVQHYDDDTGGTAWDGPLVVLVSKFSASASEIFAGAIQDYGRGLIVGDPATHGKGTVQTLRDVSEELFFGPNQPRLGALKLTMQKFYRPSGDSTQNRGVLSDIEIPSLTAELPVGESDLDHALEFDRVDPAAYRRMNMVDPQLIEQLRILSRERCELSSDFQKVRRDIERYLEQKNRKAVSLNEEKFLAARKDVDADREEERQLDAVNNPENNKIERNYYLDESFAITLDYLRLFRVAQAN